MDPDPVPTLARILSSVIFKDEKFSSSHFSFNFSAGTLSQSFSLKNVVDFLAKFLC
jgi:hypothetical protein